MASADEKAAAESVGTPSVDERVAGLSSRLPRGRQGYYRTATDELLAELATREAELERECSGLRDRVTELEAELDDCRTQEELVSKTMVTAISHSMKIRESARREAEATLRGAAAKAAEQDAAAQQLAHERAKVEQELRRLRELTREVQGGLTSFLASTLAQLGVEDDEALRTGESPGNRSSTRLDQTLADRLESALRLDTR